MEKNTIEQFEIKEISIGLSPMTNLSMFMIVLIMIWGILVYGMVKGEVNKWVGNRGMVWVEVIIRLMKGRGKGGSKGRYSRERWFLLKEVNWILIWWILILVWWKLWSGDIWDGNNEEEVEEGINMIKSIWGIGLIKGIKRGEGGKGGVIIGILKACILLWVVCMISYIRAYYICIGTKYIVCLIICILLLFLMKKTWETSIFDGLERRIYEALGKEWIEVAEELKELEKKYERFLSDKTEELNKSNDSIIEEAEKICKEYKEKKARGGWELKKKYYWIKRLIWWEEYIKPFLGYPGVGLGIIPIEWEWRRKYMKLRGSRWFLLGYFIMRMTRDLEGGKYELWKESYKEIVLLIVIINSVIIIWDLIVGILYTWKSSRRYKKIRRGERGIYNKRGRFALMGLIWKGILGLLVLIGVIMLQKEGVMWDWNEIKLEEEVEKAFMMYIRRGVGAMRSAIWSRPKIQSTGLRVEKIEDHARRTGLTGENVTNALKINGKVRFKKGERRYGRIEWKDGENGGKSGRIKKTK